MPHESSSSFTRIKPRRDFVLIDFKVQAACWSKPWGTTREQVFDHEKRDPTTTIIESKRVGERGRNRTFNLLIKSQLLCQLSYAPGNISGNSGRRTQ